MSRDLEKILLESTKNIENSIDVLISHLNRGDVYQDKNEYDLAIQDL